MWKIVDDDIILGKTRVFEVNGGWLVKVGTSGNITFFADENHQSFSSPVVVKDPAPSEPLTYIQKVYTDGWEKDWTHFSWAKTDDGYIKNGNTVIRSDIDGWSAFNAAFRNGTFSPLNTKGIGFKIKSEVANSPADTLAFSVTNGRTTLGSINLGTIFPNGFPKDFQEVFITFEELGLSYENCTNFLIAGKSSDKRDAIFIDDVYLVKYEIEQSLPIPKPDLSPAIASPFSLSVSGNKILDNGVEFQGKGVNLHDTRGNNACAYTPPNVGEVIRRLDHLKSKGVTIVRMIMESYAVANGRVNYKSIFEDSAYLEDIKTIVSHAGKLGLKIMVTPFVDPSVVGSSGEVTPGLIQFWQKMTSSFIDSGHIIFGIINEPEMNNDGSRNDIRRQGFLDAIDAIRSAEKPGQEHIIAVQGIAAWGREMMYWVNNPINKTNIVYEVHAYDPQNKFNERFIIPSRTLPIIIGEFGPDGTYMDLPGCEALILKANELNITWLGWAFHPQSPPSMLINNGNNCGIDMDLNQLTPWGQLIIDNL